MTSASGGQFALVGWCFAAVERNGIRYGCANNRSGTRHDDAVAPRHALPRTQDRLEPDRRCAEPDHHRGRDRGALSHPARHRCRRAPAGAESNRLADAHYRRPVRRRRLCDVDLLRSVRAAHDRPRRSAVSHRRARRLHQLCDRAQCRRQRVFRRCGALPHLFRLGTERHRGHQNLLRRRADVLARQRHRARLGHSRCAASRARARSAAALGQPRPRARDSGAARRLCRLGLGQAARHRPRRLAGAAARRPADARPDRHRHRRSRLLRGRHVHAGAGRAACRLRYRRGDFRRRDAARICQPRARRPRRVRRRHDGGAVAVRQGRSAGRPAAVPAACITSFRSCSRSACSAIREALLSRAARRISRASPPTRMRRTAECRERRTWRDRDRTRRCDQAASDRAVDELG